MEEASPNLKAPAFRINSPTVFARRVTCQICFISVERNKIKRNKFERINDINKFQTYSQTWYKTHHDDYKRVFSLVDWSQLNSKKEIWGHKSCKGKFFQETFISSYEEKYREKDDNSTAITPDDDAMEIDDAPSYVRESRSNFSDSGGSCIICNEKKYERKGRVVPLVLITLRENTTKSHKAGEKLKEFADIHLSNGKTPISGWSKTNKAPVKRQEFLFAADVSYHRDCYLNFRSPKWKRSEIVSETCTTSAGSAGTADDHFQDFCEIVQFHIIERKEVYTTSQLVNCYREYTGLSGTRSTDLRKRRKEKFGDKLQFEKSGNTPRDPEYVLPTDANLTASCINVASAGGAISKTASIRNMARILHKELIDTSENRNQWPPTPNDIITSEGTANKNLFNQIAWIIGPRQSLNKNGFVNLSSNKSLKVQQICQNLQSLLPKSQPSLDQLLLAPTLHRKTGSSDVVHILNRLGYGVPYTELLFVLNKWADWASKQKTHIPPNIDWARTQVHHTNSILIQHVGSGTEQEYTNVHLQADYEFDRNTFRSFKADKKNFPETKFRRVPCTSLSSPEFTGNPQMIQSSKKTLCWVLMQMIAGAPDKQNIPAWSAFQQLASAGNISSGLINVGYLPPITDTQTKWSACFEIIKRTVETMNELELEFIFLECDQAIYTKVLQIMFKLERENKDLYGRIVLRMGGFHVLMCMLKTIYSRFKGCGFVKLLAEIGIGGEGTIKKALNGGDVKEGVRLYKLLLLAVLRSKVKYLMGKHTVPWYKKTCFIGNTRTEL